MDFRDVKKNYANEISNMAEPFFLKIELRGDYIISSGPNFLFFEILIFSIFLFGILIVSILKFWVF